MGSGSNTTDAKNFKDIYPHSACFDIYIRPVTGKDNETGRLGAEIDYAENPYFFLGRIYRQGKSPENQRNGIKITNLPWGQYEIVIDPQPKLGNFFQTGNSSYDLGAADYSGTDYLKKNLSGLEWLGLEPESGDIYAIAHPVTFNNGQPKIYWLFENPTHTIYDTGWDWFGSGETIKLSVEGGSLADISRVEEDLDVDYLKRSLSTESAPYLTVTNVSEQVDLAKIGLPEEETIEVQSVPGIALIAMKVKASERMQQSPQANFLISAGKKIKNHWASGIAEATNNYVLTDSSADFFEDAPSIAETDLYLRNLSKGTSSKVQTVNTTSLQTINALEWEAEDRYLLYTVQASSYFPDVFCDLLTAKVGGVGNYIDPDEMIDYDSIVASRKFCVERDFYYDEALTEKTSWAQWASKNAVASLLYPARISGKLGLKPESATEPPTAIFNDSNIIRDSFSESYVPWYDQDVNRLTMTYLDGRYKRFDAVSFTVMSDLAYLNEDTLITEESLDLPSITHEKQALQVAGLYMKSRVLQFRNISFTTSPHGLFVNPGDLIIVQSKSTEYDYEVNGYVYRADTYNGVSQPIRLSRKTPLTFTEVYSLSIWHKNTGNIEYDLPFTAFVNSADEDNVWINVTSLSEEILPGDYIVIGMDITEDSMYRVSQISFSEEGQIKIDATLWDSRVTDISDLLYSPIRKTMIWVTEGVDSDNWTTLIESEFSPLEDYTFPF
jgi:hypothetical protein